ncbi:MAG: glycosyltransferase family 4 protein [Candidatus Obscuribacterales bacterium]|nr:glycosyltransferase family 4 protein [Candidatus Obscuribacterales bacterium]
MTIRKLRVCLISREYPPETGWGGIATFTRHLAHGLKDIGHHVEVVSLSKDHDKTVDDDGVKVHRVSLEWIEKNFDSMNACIPYSHYVLSASVSMWRKFLELHKQQAFDVVDTPELLAEGFFPALTRILPLVIRLYTPHSKFIREGLHNVTPSFDHEFIAAIERVAMTSADVLTSPSLDLRDYVAGDLHIESDKIEIVRNPIDPDQFSPDGVRLLPDTKKIRVLFVGRLEERKGIQYLVDAIPMITRKNRNVEFVVIGDDTKNATGQTSELHKLKNTIARDGTGEFIQFINRVPLADLPGYYRSADICVVPSVYDNSPYTCLEAMSCGRPVVGTAGGGTKEYLTHEQSGIIVEPKDPQAIADALLRLIENEDLRSRMGREARARVLHHFQRKEIARQTAGLYELAATRFSQSSESQVYKKAPDAVIEDAVYMMKTFDTMVFDTLYRFSYRFRFIYWYKLLKKRPGLFTAKMMLKAANVASVLTGSRIAPLNRLRHWLTTEIARRSVDQTMIQLLQKTPAKESSKEVALVASGKVD